MKTHSKLIFFLLAGGLDLSVATSAINAFLGGSFPIGGAGEFNNLVIAAMIFCGFLLVGMAFSRHMQSDVKTIIACLLLWPVLWGWGIFDFNAVIVTHVLGGVLGIIATGIAFRSHE